MKPTRVLYTIPELCVGGAEHQLLELARGLDRRRFTPAIAVLRPGGTLEVEARYAGIETVEAPRRSRFDLSPCQRLAAWMVSRRVGVVHSFLFLDGFYARLAAVAARVPVRIASLRGVDYAPGSVHACVDRCLKEFTSCLVANSDWMRRRARAVGMTRVRFEVIPNGVDADRFAAGDRAAARQKIGLRPDDFAVAIVGRLSPEKDHGTFLRAAVEAAKRSARAVFLIVGDGPERLSVERTIAYMGIEDRARLLGARSDVPDLMPAFDALALTSLSESFPNAVLEGMAAGLAVTATDVGGVPEMVEHGVSGLLSPAGDSRAMAENWLRIEADAALRSRLGAAARRRARDVFSLSSMVQRYESLYRELLSKGAARP
jgi:glycosyltransferase involved in cell wall biosynthesis